MPSCVTRTPLRIVTIVVWLVSTSSVAAVMTDAGPVVHRSTRADLQAGRSAQAARVLADLLDLVLPRDCAGCRTPGRTLCPACRRELRATPFDHAPTPPPPGLPPLRAALPYDGVVRELLLAHKERGRTTLARPLGALLAAAVGLQRPGVVLVPVPSAPAAVRERGHDHARRLAACAARRAGLRSAPLLAPARAVGDQSGLDAAGRAANLHGALVARGRLDGLPVLLVDDVVTTGATLAEAARALRAGGAHVLGGAVVAATFLRRRRHP